jgi:hypothetical protein
MLLWTSKLPKSNIMGRKFFYVVFHSGIDVGGEDTMGTGRPSGMSIIIKSTPTPELCTPLKARALLDLSCTLKTTISMILIAML